MKEGVSFWYMTALMAMLCIGAGMHLLPGTNVPGFGQAAVKFGSEQATAGLSEVRWKYIHTQEGGFCQTHARCSRACHNWTVGHFAARGGAPPVHQHFFQKLYNRR